MRMMPRYGIGLAVAASLALGSGGTALAAGGTSAVKSCWGTVVSQRAVAYGDIGEHSASFAGEARIGVGNLPRVLNIPGADTVGELAALLAELDGLDATHCPR